MSGPSLALFLWFIVVSHATSERRPLRAAVDQVLDAFLDVVAPVSDVLGDSPCRRQGLLYRRAAKEGKLWALRMLDAGAKIPSGLMLHNVVQLGDFPACLDVHHEDPKEGTVVGQHCQVSFGPLDALSALSIHAKGNTGGFNITHFDHYDELLERGDYLEAFRLVGGSWAVCVPAACSAAELQLHLRTVLPEPLIRVDKHACTSQADAVLDWDWHAVVAIVLLSMLSVLLALGTAYDLLTGDPSGPPRIGHPLLAFSLYNNMRLLFGYDIPLINAPIKDHSSTMEGSPKTGGATNSEKVSKIGFPKKGNDLKMGDALESFHGVRSITTFGITLGHYYLLRFTSPLANIDEVVHNVMKMSRMLSSNATLFVDTFLVMSGILLAYSFIRQRERKAEFSWRRFFINRYVRLAPAHVASVLMGVAVLPFVQKALNAPLLKANLAPLRDTCFNARWLSLLYISNYFDTEHVCQNVAWYLSIEVQLLLVSPLVLYPLWRRPRLGLVLLALLSFTVTASVFSIAYEHRLHFISALMETNHSANMDHVYFFTHTRCVPWFIGLAVGSLLSCRVVPSRRQAVLGWCACACLAYYSMFHANASFQHDFVPDRLHSAIYFAVIRPSWALASAWVLYACETGAGGYLHAFLGWRGWQLTSRLSYAVLLQHLQFMFSIPIRSLGADYGTDSRAYTEYLGNVVMSLGAAVVLHVAVEMPCYILYHAYQAGATVAAKRKKN